MESSSYVSGDGLYKVDLQIAPIYVVYPKGLQLTPKYIHISLWTNGEC